jgi:hypothetical protein
MILAADFLVWMVVMTLVRPRTVDAHVLLLKLSLVTGLIGNSVHILFLLLVRANGGLGGIGCILSRHGWLGVGCRHAIVFVLFFGGGWWDWRESISMR